MGKNKGWKSLVAKVAPVLATALGGPMAGVGVKVLAETLGLPSDTPEDQLEALVAQEVQSNPEVAVRLREAEQAFELRCRQMGIDYEKMFLEDVQDAREMNVASGQGFVKKLSFTFVLAFFVLFGVLVASFSFGLVLSSEAMILITALVSILADGVKQVMSYWLGSSSGSKDKTDTLSEALKDIRGANG